MADTRWRAFYQHVVRYPAWLISGFLLPLAALMVIETVAIDERMVFFWLIPGLFCILPLALRYWRRHRGGAHYGYSVDLPRGGRVFLGLLGVLLLLALSSGNNLLYLLFSAALGTMVVSLLVSRLMVSRLSVSIRYPEQICAGEATSLDLTIASRRRLMPSVSLLVSTIEEGPGAPAQRATVATGYFPMLSAGSEARLKVERIFARRGVIRLRGFLVESRFPFGFIGHRRGLMVEEELLVLPEKRSLEDLLTSLPLEPGRFESRTRGSGSDLHSIRDYLPTDSRRRVDWRATARTGRMMVREFTREDDWRVTIIFDARIDDSASAKRELLDAFEEAVGLAAGLIRHLIGLGAAVRLVTSEGETGFGTSERHLLTLLERLARLPVGSEPPPPGRWHRLRRQWRRERMVADQALFDADLLRLAESAGAGERHVVLITAAPRGLLHAMPADRVSLIHLDQLADRLRERKEASGTV